MGKAALLAVSAFIITASYYNLTSLESNAGAVRATSRHQLGILARHGALAGYEQAKQAVADAGSLAPFVGGKVSYEGRYDDASFLTTVSSDGETATIASVGTMSTGAEEVSFTIEAVVELADEPPVDVPPFLSYALITEESLNLNGNVGADVDDPDSQHNANFHTNRNLHINGNAADVAGFGSYVGMGTSNPASALANTFQPHYNPDHLETAYQASAVDIPAFDGPEFLERVDADRSSAGNVLLSGSIDLGGTKDDPYVWHIQGDLTAAGESTVQGYVMFIVEGDINLSGNLIAGGREPESTVALYAGNDVNITGNIKIYGQIYAEGNVAFSGTPDIYGSVASHASAVISGTPDIHYRPASPALSTIFSDESHLRLLSYYEH